MLEIVDLSVQFRMHSQVINALEHVNLKIKDREKIAIIGESGSGKSVLALAILGLLPENAIVTGKIFLDGEELLGKNQKEMTKVLGTKLSYVPQGSGNSLNPLIKIGYQVSESLIEHKKITKKEALKKKQIITKEISSGTRRILGIILSTYSFRRDESARITGTWNCTRSTVSYCR